MEQGRHAGVIATICFPPSHSDISVAHVVCGAKKYCTVKQGREVCGWIGMDGWMPAAAAAAAATASLADMSVIRRERITCSGPFPLAWDFGKALQRPCRPLAVSACCCYSRANCGSCTFHARPLGQPKKTAGQQASQPASQPEHAPLPSSVCLKRLPACLPANPKKKAPLRAPVPHTLHATLAHSLPNAAGTLHPTEHGQDTDEHSSHSSSRCVVVGYGADQVIRRPTILVACLGPSLLYCAVLCGSACCTPSSIQRRHRHACRCGSAVSACLFHFQIQPPQKVWYMLKAPALDPKTQCAVDSMHMSQDFGETTRQSADSHLRSPQSDLGR